MGEIREPQLIENNRLSEETKDAGIESPVEKKAETRELPFDFVGEIMANLIDSGFSPEAVDRMNQKLKDVPKCDLMSVIGDCQRELLNPYSPSSIKALKMILEESNRLNAADSLADQHIERELRRGVSYPGAVKAESRLESKSAALPIEKKGIPLHVEKQTESLVGDVGIKELEERRKLSAERADELREHLNKQKLEKGVMAIAEKQEGDFRPVKKQRESFLTRIMSAAEHAISGRSSKSQ